MRAGSSTASDSRTSSPAVKRAPTSNTAITRSRIASVRAAWRCIRSATQCSSTRSSTSATIPSTRFRPRASGASTAVVSTRCMPTAEAPHTATARVDAQTRPQGARRWAWAGLAAVLLGGLGLRLWGVRQGLPYAYNSDEADHFVPHAIEMFQQGTLNPHYFANPPALTYLLHYVYAIAYGGATGVAHEYLRHPEAVYTLARVVVAVLGTVALWLLYAAGTRLFNRAVGLLAAAIEAVAFLPVFYAHLALNDVPTLFPLTLSLLGSAGVLRKGRRRDYLLAGVGLGLACASKYTAGIVLLPLLAAAAARYLNVQADARAYVVGRRAVIGLLLAGLAALLAF